MHISKYLIAYLRSVQVRGEHTYTAYLLMVNWGWVMWYQLGMLKLLYYTGSMWMMKRRHTWYFTADGMNKVMRPCVYCVYSLRVLCVFFTLNCSFYPSTSSTTSVRANYLILERYIFCCHKLRHRDAADQYIVTYMYVCNKHSIETPWTHVFIPNYISTRFSVLNSSNNCLPKIPPPPSLER